MSSFQTRDFAIASEQVELSGTAELLRLHGAMARLDRIGVRVFDVTFIAADRGRHRVTFRVHDCDYDDANAEFDDYLLGA